jgi:hypothetical protein
MIEKLLLKFTKSDIINYEGNFTGFVCNISKTILSFI